MKIINLPISQITQYANNPRANDGAVPYVADSIQEYGFRVPILIDRNYVIIAGHTRYKAAKKLGMTELPCIIADDLTPAQVKAYRLMDNKASEKSKWNEELLAQEFEALANEGFDLTKTAFEPFEIESITNGLFDDGGEGFDVEADEDETPDIPDSSAEPVDERFSMIVCCHTDEEKAAVQEILGIKGELRRLYTFAEIRKMRESDSDASQGS